MLTAQVDLGQVRSVGVVKIWNRGEDCCKDRLDGFSVYVGNSATSYDDNTACFTGGVAPLTSPYTVLCVGREGGCVSLRTRVCMHGWHVVGLFVRFWEGVLDV